MIPSGTEDKVVVPTQVITRAQAKEKIECGTEELVQDPTKKRKNKTKQLDSRPKWGLDEKG